MYHNEKFMSRVVLKKVFSKSECEEIISKSELIEDALLENGKKDISIRNTHTRKLSLQEDDIWIINRIYNTVIKANDTYFQFDVQKMAPTHILEYTEGCFYDWHLDIGGTYANCTRKLSALVFLSDRNDYEGGELDWSINNANDSLKLDQEQGAMIIFPSFLPHKVKPVTKGLRRVLVTWFHGDTFK